MLLTILTILISHIGLKQKKKKTLVVFNYLLNNLILTIHFCGHPHGSLQYLFLDSTE